MLAQPLPYIEIYLRYETGGDGDGLILMDWYEIEMGQEESAGQHRYYVKIRGTEVQSITNPSALSLTNVRAFIGNPFITDEKFTDVELRNIQG